VVILASPNTNGHSPKARLVVTMAEASPRFRGFVVAHELLHFRVPNHGKLFKALMTVHVPGWRQHEVDKG